VSTQRGKDHHHRRLFDLCVPLPRHTPGAPRVKQPAAPPHPPRPPHGGEHGAAREQRGREERERGAASRPPRGGRGGELHRAATRVRACVRERVRAGVFRFLCATCHSSLYDALVLWYRRAVD